MTDLTLCDNWNLEPVTPKRAIRVAILTSIRDVGKDDCNGVFIPTPQGQKYMEGAIERLVQETLPGGSLHGVIEVAAVITDDLERDMEGSIYPLTPQFGKPWVFSQDLILANGTALTTRTHHFRSDFRDLPKNAVKERAERKFNFERKIACFMEFLHIDVLISDHYMARLEHLIAPNGERGFGLFGRVLNIHPAVTVRNHPFCFRGKSPTKEAIERAKSGIHTMTGATLHLIDSEIDHGPPIAYAVPTVVQPNDEPQWLRWRNYQGAKLPILIEGLRHYALRIFPHLANGLDLNALVAQEAA